MATQFKQERRQMTELEREQQRERDEQERKHVADMLKKN
jgi:hypothetical protein